MYCPAGHAMHADWPVEPWYVPAEQAVHDVRPVVEANVPQAQAVQGALPVPLYWPTGHSCAVAATARHSMMTIVFCICGDCKSFLSGLNKCEEMPLCTAVEAISKVFNCVTRRR
jgi:hypothetical protein